MPTSSHSRHTSAISTSSAIRSASPSPPVSPVSPNGEGLSRRLSWNRIREDALTVQDMHSGPGLAGLSRTHLMQPTDEYDLGSGSSPQSQPVNRPFFHQFSSDASLDSTADRSSGQSEGDVWEDRERLTPFRSGMGLNGIGHRRQPSRRMYDEHWMARTSGPAKFAASVGRHPTFRSVSRTLRKASIRVVNIMGSDHEHGMVRLGDGEELEELEEVDKKVHDEGDGQVPLPNPMIIPPQRPDPMPHQGRLRGRTLCFFGTRSWTRRAMDGLLRYP